MDITRIQKFTTKTNNIGTQYNIKNKSKNILVKLEEVTIFPNENNKVAIKINNEDTFNILTELQEKINNFIISQFETSNDCISPIVYTSDNGNSSIYSRLNSYSLFYNAEGEEYKYENKKIFADIILKFDTITHVNNMYYINASLYQGLVHDVIKVDNASKLLLRPEEFINNF